LLELVRSNYLRQVQENVLMNAKAAVSPLEAVPGLGIGEQPAPRSYCLPVIESIATGTPDNVVLQSDAAQFVASLPALEQNRSRIEKLYQNTRIEMRQLAVNLFSTKTLGFIGQRGTLDARMQLYKDHAVPLAERVARQALATANTPDVEEAIGLIAFVSSTGFVAPGVDAELIKRLGLRRDIARVPVNFMGCAAAMNGLRVAGDYVRSHPTRKALVICLELSSVNAVFEDNINDVIIHSLFGDGCAAVVIGNGESGGAGRRLAMHEHFSYLVEETEDGITLGVQDNGITCKLSRHLPDYIEAGVGAVVERFLLSHGLTQESIDLWAVHPGGTRILEKAQVSLGLDDRQLTDSWEVLRQHGNMLSASVLFVLERMLLRCGETRETELEQSICEPGMTGLAFSFSPGVGIEGLLFQII
jgi:alpha-pyrone synthase